jgi:curli production assembly/transport component CsgF
MAPIRVIFIFLLFTALIQTAGFSQSLIYRPINPAFGGNPNNYSWIIGTAESQNIYKSSASNVSRLPSTTTNNSVNNFTDNLTRQILSKLSSSILGNQFGENTYKEGTYQYGDLKVDISNGQNGVNIRIVDNKGGETVITVPYY